MHWGIFNLLSIPQPLSTSSPAQSCSELTTQLTWSHITAAAIRHGFKLHRIGGKTGEKWASRTCCSSGDRNAPFKRSRAAEGSTNLRFDPIIRANKYWSSCINTIFLFSCRDSKRQQHTTRQQPTSTSARTSDKVCEGDYPQLKTIYVETRKGILRERQKRLFSEAAALPPVRKMHSQGEILAKVRSLAGGKSRPQNLQERPGLQHQVTHSASLGLISSTGHHTYFLWFRISQSLAQREKSWGCQDDSPLSWNYFSNFIPT